jgi:predicted ATPase
MIKEISIENFKSVQDLKMDLGRVTVLIGENGSGKSNILEAIALLSAAIADKLDNEFLVSRGIRVAERSMMISAFADQNGSGQRSHVKLKAVAASKKSFSLSLTPAVDRWSPVPGFKVDISAEEADKEKKLEDENTLKDATSKDIPTEFRNLKIENTENGFKISFEGEKLSNESLKSFREILTNEINARFPDFLKKYRIETEKDLHCSQFLIYSPENSALRRFEEEGQIQPVGIRGEGLFKMLQGFTEEPERLSELKKSLELAGWFFDFSISPNLAPGENRLQIQDRFLGPKIPFDQRSANEGFLFLIFYFAVLLSKATPEFFAIDNIDAALNPKLCAELMRRICELAKKYSKQVIVTTHNPAILDGLNLSDEEQRLYTVYRNDEGRTRLRRIYAPKARAGDIPTKLSDAFMHGLIGGLPKNF